MRPIKFRAWDNKKKKMRFLENSDFEITYSGLYVHGEFDTYTKVDWPLEQFTGLLDKNGKEIYEGDVISGVDYNDFNRTGVVEFVDGTFCLTGIGISMGRRVRVWSDGCNDWHSIENLYDLLVLGNIHENPELVSQ